MGWVDIATSCWQTKRPMNTERSKGLDSRGTHSRSALLKGARKLFAEKGFEGTSVGAIADSAGLRKASLFHYFATKDDIYIEVMDGIFTELANTVGAAATTEGPPLQRLDTLSDAITDFFAEHPQAVRLLFRAVLEGAHEGPELLPDRRAAAVRILQAADGFLLAGMGQGIFVQQDSKQLLLSIVGLHLTYFIMNVFAEPFLGHDLASQEAKEARKQAVRAHVRALVTGHPSS